MTKATRGSTFTIAVGEYVVRCAPGDVGAGIETYARHATLVEQFDKGSGEPCCIDVTRVSDRWPFLVVEQANELGDAGFAPGVLVAPEVDRLFIGVGPRLLAYDLAAPRRLWTSRTEGGLWTWARHGDVALMSAELELAAWTVTGEPLWTTFVEPPWEYAVVDGTVVLDVMGTKRNFPIHTGPVPTGST